MAIFIFITFQEAWMFKDYLLYVRLCFFWDRLVFSSSALNRNGMPFTEVCLTSAGVCLIGRVDSYKLQGEQRWNASVRRMRR